MDSTDVLNWTQTGALVATLLATVGFAVWGYRTSREDRKVDATERATERRRRVKEEELERVATRLLGLGEAAIITQSKTGEMDRFLSAKRNLKTALALQSESLSTVEWLTAENRTPAEVTRVLDEAVAELRAALDGLA